MLRTWRKYIDLHSLHDEKMPCNDIVTEKKLGFKILTSFESHKIQKQYFDFIDESAKFESTTFC